MEYYTTKSDFDYFCKRGQYWIKFWGLLEWDVDYIFDRDREENENIAYCISNLTGRAATIGLCINWGITKPTKTQIDRAAFHEVGELLMSPVNILSKERFVTEDMIDDARHAVLRRLENKFCESSAGPKKH
jgi:hypothetical protein